VSASFGGPPQTYDWVVENLDKRGLDD